MPPKIAVQLYSLRDALARDPAGVIGRLAQIGYRAAELHQFDHAPRLVQLCRDAGIEMISAHMPLPLEDQAARVFDQAEDLGIKRLLVPWQDPAEFADVMRINRVCDVINRVGEKAKARGFQLGYHNHWFELDKVSGRTALQIMADYLAPHIFFEVDCYWVQTGGGDPGALLEALAGRTPLVHVKDGPAARPEDDMVAVGHGALDYPRILAHAQADYLIVELDRCATDMLDALAASFRYLTDRGLAQP